MNRRHLLFAGIAVPLSSCVALPYGTYYRPSSADAGARVRGAWCGGQAGPGSVIRINGPLGVVLEATTDKPHARRGEPGVPLRFAAAPTLVDPASGRTIDAAFAVRVFSRVTLAGQTTVDPMALRPAGAAGRGRDATAPHGRASWALQLPTDFAPPSFQLQLPSLQQGGRLLSTPAVVLSRPGSAKRPGDYRSEAEQQYLREREAACRRDTPRLACENIVPHSERSFALRAGPLQWEGRWARYEGGNTPAPVRATQALVVADPGPWQLSEAAFTLTEATTGRRLTLPLTQTHFDFDDTIAFDAPMLTTSVPQRESLRVFVEADLPDGLPAFELRLPPLRVGGQTVPFSPIRFERRSFDGGIEPLNC